jgi:hypothetical protein
LEIAIPAAYAVARLNFSLVKTFYQLQF